MKLSSVRTRQAFGRLAIVCSLSLLSFKVPLNAHEVFEDFSSAPTDRGWFATGETSLFNWESGRLRVTWDSSKTNSYFAWRLPSPLTLERDFALEFDLELQDFQAGVFPGKVSTFPLGIGFIQLAAATGPGYIRGFTSSHQVEFSFWPDPGGDWQWGPSVSSVLVDSTGFGWAYGNGFFGLGSNTVYRISLGYNSAEKTLATTVVANGQSVGTVGAATIAAGFKELLVDHVAVPSYSDAGQDPAYAGSLLAHGWVDNVKVTFPIRLKQTSEGLKFATLTNFNYTVQTSTNALDWSDWHGPLAGTGGEVTATHASAPVPPVFFRVQATRQ